MICQTVLTGCCCVTYRDLDEIEDRCKRLELALRGVFAGNVFDLGAQGTADMFENGEVCSPPHPPPLPPAPPNHSVLPPLFSLPSGHIPMPFAVQCPGGLLELASAPLFYVTW